MGTADLKRVGSAAEESVHAYGHSSNPASPLFSVASLVQISQQAPKMTKKRRNNGR